MNKAMNSTQEEAISTLLEWAEGDEGNRGLLIITDDEESLRKTYHGSSDNLVLALANAMLKDEVLFSLCATAIHICRTNKANDYDEE